MEGIYYEVIAPEIWRNANAYTEQTYDETVKIVNGRGTCKSPFTAKRLENFGYTIIKHKPATEGV
jgi:hypothetical protein